MKTKLRSFLARAAMTLLAALCVQFSAWAQNSVSTVTTTEQLVKESTVYVGEVVVDGETQVKYLYSSDLTFHGIPALLSALKGMGDSDYADMLERYDFSETESIGFAICSNPELAAAMDANWSSARNVGAQYYPYKVVASETNENLYDLDEE